MKRFIVGWLATVLSAASYAQVAPISQWQCDMMKKNNVLSSGAPVGCERLSKVDFDFINFKGEMQQGNMIVLDVVAPSVEQIFSELKQRNFPLHSARLMREFKGDDNASMDANNSSAFNARPITGGGGWSKHAYGVAIDINPVQNPFLAFDINGRITVKPSQSATRYVNRTRFRARDEIERRGMAEDVVELFAHHGFMIWGGDWNTQSILNILRLDQESSLPNCSINRYLKPKCYLSVTSNLIANVLIRIKAKTQKKLALSVQRKQSGLFSAMFI